MPPKPTGGFRHFIALLKYARPYRRAVALQFLLMGIAVGFGLLKPWPLKVLVDNVAGDDPFSIAGWSPEFTWQTLLLGACLAHLIFHAGESLIQVGSNWVATLTSSKMIRDLRSDLLSRLQILSLRFHDKSRIGDLVHRVTWNSTAVETAFQSGFMGLSKSLVMLAGMFTIMMFMNPVLTLVALAVVPLLLLIIRQYAGRTHRVSLEHQTQEGMVSSTLQEILSGIRLVKAYNREEVERGRFGDICTRSVATRLRSVLVQNRFSFLTALTLAGGTALLFWAGMRQVVAENLTVGEFLVFVAYLAMLYGPLSVLSYTASSVQSALGGGSRLFEILESSEEIPEPENPKTLRTFSQGIEFDAVTFAYEPGKPVLHDISLSLRKGETIGVVGETGSGKSTLLNLILRFYDPDSGTVTMDGIDLRQMRSAEVRRHVAYAPQDTLLLSDTIRENIAYGRPGATEEEIIEAARKAEALPFIEQCEEGFDTIVGERGIRLSTGQRQRIALARAFLKDSPVLLLDEPTSALDGETEAAIVERVARLQDKTVLIIAHRLSTIRFADRVYVITGGKVAETGTHEQLLASGGAYNRLWQAQLTAYGEAE